MPVSRKPTYNDLFEQFYCGFQFQTLHWNGTYQCYMDSPPLNLFQAITHITDNKLFLIKSIPTNFPSKHRRLGPSSSLCMCTYCYDHLLYCLCLCFHCYADYINSTSTSGPSPSPHPQQRSIEHNSIHSCWMDLFILCITLDTPNTAIFVHHSLIPPVHHSHTPSLHLDFTTVISRNKPWQQTFLCCCLHLLERSAHNHTDPQNMTQNCLRLLLFAVFSFYHFLCVLLVFLIWSTSEDIVIFILKCAFWYNLSGSNN